MSLLVMKFGGTSVGSAAAINAVATIAREQRTSWERIAIVVSAMSGVTDLLIHATRSAESERNAYKAIAAQLREKHDAVITELLGNDNRHADRAVRIAIDQLIDEFEMLCHSVGVLGEVSPRALDAISSLGERMSARIVAATLSAHGLPSEAIDASEIVITTDHFGSAIPIQPLTNDRIRTRLMPLLENGMIPVITGYIGATQLGATTTLGRGGSDYSGAIVGAALDADEVAIYTDVDGVMTTDPRLVHSAHVLPSLSYAEMGELAYFGAKVLHPRTVRPVVERGIPLRIRNTFNPSHSGTLIQRTAGTSHSLKAVTSIRGMSLITIEGRGMIGVPGIAARIFSAVASVGANVLMISQASSEQSICLIVLVDVVATVTHAIEEMLRDEIERRDIDRIAVRSGVVIVTVVGAGMRETPGIASQVFGVLGQNHINVIAIAQGSTECSISMVVDGADGDATVRVVHDLIAQEWTEQP